MLGLYYLLSIGATAILLDMIRFPRGHIFSRFFQFPIDVSSSKRFWRNYNYYFAYPLYACGIHGLALLVADFFIQQQYQLHQHSFGVRTLGLCLANGVLATTSSIYVLVHDYEQSGPGAGLGVMMGGCIPTAFSALLGVVLQDFNVAVILSSYALCPIVMLSMLFGRATSSD